MIEFSYKINDAQGIHARPAGFLAKEAKRYMSETVITVNERSAKATNIMEIMGLNVQSGDIVKVKISGIDEYAAYEGIKKFFENNL